MPSQNQNPVQNQDNEEHHRPAPATMGQGDAQRPSEAWLRNPSWIDGGVNPPRYYYSQDEINASLIAAGANPAVNYNQHAARVVPTPPGSQPPAPLIPVPVNVSSNYYHAEPEKVNEDRGHLVNVTLVYPTTPTVTSRPKNAPKKSKMTKMDHINMDGVSRVDFIKAFLAIHGLSDKFSPGIHMGPDFKVLWNGSSGGKAGAPSIQNDHQFGIALEALLKKDKSKTQVHVEIDLDDMERFRIKEILPLVISDVTAAGTDEELAYGTRVPQVENFTEESQLHGRLIIELKKKWPCQQHRGEHGEPGFCYVNANSEHIRLNALRLRTWAASMAANDSTKHEPPNVMAFDGARDGHLNSAKPRGRHAAFAAATPPANGASDVMATLLLALMSRKRSRSESLSPSKQAPSTPKRAKAVPLTDSPLPAAGHELRKCLEDFALSEGIDLTLYESTLLLEDYTPDIIPFVEDEELRRITGASRGVVIKFKMFCKQWYNQYVQKLLAHK